MLIHCIIIFCSKCQSHYVEVFKGKGSSGKSLKSLCGYVANEETVTLENGKHLTVGFCVRIYDTITIATHTLLPAIIESFHCLNFFSNTFM